MARLRFEIADAHACLPTWASSVPLARAFWCPAWGNQSEAGDLSMGFAGQQFPKLDFVVASVDGAFTENELNDPSAMTVWGTFWHPE